MGNNSSVPATPGMFRNILAPLSAVFLGTGALLGLGSVLYLLDGSYLNALTEKILISGIRTASALSVWRAMHILISLISTFCPALVVFCMIRAFRGQAARGMNLLSGVSHGLLFLLRILGWLAIGLFVLRFTRYVISISHRLLCRFLDEAEGCTASIGYTLSSGYLDPVAIPAYVSGGLTLLGILGLVLTADRLVTMTIGYDGYKQFYQFVWSVHPGQWLCAGSLFFGALGDFFLGAYLRFYKRMSERAVFFASYK